MRILNAIKSVKYPIPDPLVIDKLELNTVVAKVPGIVGDNKAALEIAELEIKAFALTTFGLNGVTVAELVKNTAVLFTYR